MKKKSAKRRGIGLGAFLLILALVAFVPGFEFSGGIPGVIQAGKTSNEVKQDFAVGVGGFVAKYEINYRAVDDPCWGSEGFSMVKGYPYFRWGTFEWYAWQQP
jgi:hypothetical protein